jgi:hypothetical protein
MDIRSEQDDYFVFKDPSCAAAHCYLFEHLWRTSVPFGERIENLA